MVSGPILQPITTQSPSNDISACYLVNVWFKKLTTFAMVSNFGVKAPLE